MTARSRSGTLVPGDNAVVWIPPLLLLLTILMNIVIGGIAALALAALAIVAGVAGTKMLNGGEAPLPRQHHLGTHVALTTEQIRQQVQGAIEQGLPRTAICPRTSCGISS